MGNFMARNIGRRGRIIRAGWGGLLVLVGILLSRQSLWACFVLIALGLFAFYEAARGWCVMRACGVKTKL